MSKKLIETLLNNRNLRNHKKIKDVAVSKLAEEYWFWLSK